MNICIQHQTFLCNCDCHSNEVEIGIDKFHVWNENKEKPVNTPKNPNLWNYYIHKKLKRLGYSIISYWRVVAKIKPTDLEKRKWAAEWSSSVKPGFYNKERIGYSADKWRRRKNGFKPCKAINDLNLFNPFLFNCGQIFQKNPLMIKS